MGTSISTTNTHQRIQQQRYQRKQGNTSKQLPSIQQFFPLNQRETTRENQIIKNTQQQNNINTQNNPIQKYSISLKTHQQSNPQEHKETQIKNNDNKNYESSKRQNLRESNPNEKNVLTIRQNKPPSNQINSQSSLQQITFSSKKIHNPSKNQSLPKEQQPPAKVSNITKPKIEVQQKTQQNEKKSKFQLKNPQQIDTKPKILTPIKPDIRLQTPVSQKDGQKIINYEPVSINPQFTQFADKQLSQREKKRKQQAIKYIKDSQFLANKKPLTNSPYQLNNNSPKKVDELLPSRSLAIDLTQNTPSNQISGVRTIKLKTQQQELDAIKGNHSMPLNKKGKNISSLNTVNKRF